MVTEIDFPLGGAMPRYYFCSLTDLGDLREHGQNAVLVNVDGHNLCRVATFCL